MIDCRRVLVALIVGWSRIQFAQATEFSLHVVDGLSRPIEGVEVNVNVLLRKPDGSVEQQSLCLVTTNAKGIARGSYDKSKIPRGEHVWVNLAKDGYPNLSSSEFEKVFVYDKDYSVSDVKQAIQAPESKRAEALREIFAAGLETDTEIHDLFMNESETVRPILRELLADAKTFDTAAHVLSIIGYPDDIRTIIKHAPKRTNDDSFENRWAYSVATAILSPTTEEEWEFLRRCAVGKLDDGWVDAGALQSLWLISGPRCATILEEVKKKNKDRRDSSLLKRFESKPPSLSGPDLAALGDTIAKALAIGKWRGNSEPRVCASGTIALIDFEFLSGRDGLTYTATFHREGDLWKLRGVRETLQVLLAKVPSQQDTPPQL